MDNIYSQKKKNHMYPCVPMFVCECVIVLLIHTIKSYTFVMRFLLFDYSWRNVCDHQNKGHKRTFTWAISSNDESSHREIASDNILWMSVSASVWFFFSFFVKNIFEILIENSDSRKTANDIWDMRPNHFVWPTTDIWISYSFQTKTYWNASMGLHLQKKNLPPRTISLSFSWDMPWQLMRKM